MRQLVIILAADFIPPSMKAPPLKYKDRPYATILKSVPATLERPEPTPDIFAPPTGNSWRGVSLPGMLNLSGILESVLNLEFGI